MYATDGTFLPSEADRKAASELRKFRAQQAIKGSD